MRSPGSYLAAGLVTGGSVAPGDGGAGLSGPARDPLLLCPGRVPARHLAGGGGAGCAAGFLGLGGKRGRDFGQAAGRLQDQQRGGPG